MSSKGWKPTQEVGGVFSTYPENPFRDANKVYLEYCSRYVSPAPAKTQRFSDSVWHTFFLQRRMGWRCAG